MSVHTIDFFRFMTQKIEKASLCVIYGIYTEKKMTLFYLYPAGCVIYGL